MHLPANIRHRKPSLRQLTSNTGRRWALRRQVLLWLRGQHPRPSGYSCEVATALQHDQADVAAFWSLPHNVGGRRQLEPIRTVAIVVALTREECYASGINPEALQNELRYTRRQLVRLEESIRREEPGLRDDGMLFEEYAEWHYEKSQNAEYKELIKHCRKLEEQLYHGTRMERMSRNIVADECYLAVPEGVLLRDEILPGWGLLVIPPEGEHGYGKVIVEQTATPRQCPMATRLHLVQNIAMTSSDCVNAVLRLRK
ncbi:MAG: hypothetical protein II943_08880 [Victivallales bacterium]|nr:hypothetical protein [Victivallales bacterium]